ncbi:hypothetical protein [Aquimarina muelleri]|uniref:Uncharacterized protein n=1 Tax=Aquimarina muelleri TaxID=279356 RepID=A0A918JYH7_9FLAO|nr:hypothetical protein [Aquimarina muelleri]MCX2763855.1 hypothetical protein [Aquimarina muelleri]GGX29285.1 hypothetical protein GCM10007384_33080 [Aquimarina muelleri]
MKKLELKNLKVKTLTRDQESAINGGFLSIGLRCSLRNGCRRLFGPRNNHDNESISPNEN